MNSSYKLFITTKKKGGTNTHCVTFPLTQKGQHEAEDLFEQMKEETAVTTLSLCRFDGKLIPIKKYEPGEKCEEVKKR